NVAEDELHVGVERRHPALFLLVAGEDTDFLLAERADPADEGVPERAGAAGHEDHAARLLAFRRRSWRLIRGLRSSSSCARYGTHDSVQTVSASYSAALSRACWRIV